LCQFGAEGIVGKISKKQELMEYIRSVPLPIWG
jgi:hypothetical protein